MSKYDLMLNSVVNYFRTHSTAMETLRDVSSGKSPISSRMMEWFVQVHSKETPVILYTNRDGSYTIRPSKEMSRINVHIDFKSCLKNHTKTYFDAFRRKLRFTFVVDDSADILIDTTLAQMNFVRWIFQNGVYKYMVDMKQELVAAFSQSKTSHRKGI